MEPLRIEKHAPSAWVAYKDRFGFVPDPMILRAGEIYLNGAKGVGALGHDEDFVWSALQENVGGLCDFFDMVVTRPRIPYINYGDTFDRRTTVSPLDELLKDRIQPVEIEYHVYHRIKSAALLKLATLDFGALGPVMNQLFELDAFRYGWQPKLDADDPTTPVDAVKAQFDGFAGEQLMAAQFLLGGLIFSGFAQASRTRHLLQPKRARFYLGMTAALDRVHDLTHAEEPVIFETAAERLKGGDATYWNGEAVPPVLPYLLGKEPRPRTVGELLDRALNFPNTGEGKGFAEFVLAASGDGLDARRAEDLGADARETALKFLAPYSNIDPEQSRPLEVTLSSEALGIRGMEVKGELRIPTWLRVWWNDNVPFGGIRKTLRRMWMAAEAYKDFSTQLRDVWARS